MDRFRLMPNYRYYNTEGASPLTLPKSVGKPLRDYKIYGASVQDGTPTPDTPVEIQSIGDLVTDKEDVNYGKYKIPITVNEDIYHIYLDEPLYKIGSYADYIDFINHKVVRKNKRATISLMQLTVYNTISENLKTYVAGGVFTDCNNANLYNVTHKCNKLKYNNGANLKPAESVGEWLAMRGNGTIYITIKTERLSEVTVEAAAEYINSLNAEIVYQLAYPTEEDISLPTIKTHKGTNIITVGTAVPASNITTQHYKYKGD